MLAVAVVGVVAGVLGVVVVRRHSGAPPPPEGGYFALVAPGKFDSLPSDAQAAAAVHRSPWEPRPENTAANRTTPPASFHTAGYSGMLNHGRVFGRVTGDFTGTTDEIIQWAAVKWGLPDDLVRAEAVVESAWYQGLKDAQGAPVTYRGYGDLGSCGGSPPPSGYGAGGPASFGILQVKWCSMKDPGAPGYDGWPWTETSTAYDVDFYGAVLRGCLEGWDVWLGRGYAAGDLMGCVGRWYSGAWHTPAAEGYIRSVTRNEQARSWRDWPDLGTPAPPASGAGAVAVPTPAAVIAVVRRRRGGATRWATRTRCTS